MLFHTQSAAVYGIDALIVDIEVNLRAPQSENDQSPAVTIVGLPDAAIRESRERIRAAIVNSSFFFPVHKMTVNLAPADVRKVGASFDLPIALAILGAHGDLVKGDQIPETLSIGELSLDGRIRPVRGALSIALRCREDGLRNLILPEENASEAAVVSDVNVYPARGLRDAVEIIRSLESGRGTAVAPLKPDPAALLDAGGRY
ncbi:MAG TPA: magnesium chelatase domain-containing protein, partial [Pyrinomonadaceae bacterium]|nr:magnesium chelatase domain-containing protein [Pyrinomonadaceae bacterium]